MWRLPLGDRWLWFTPPLSSSPGQAPTHEERHFSEGKVAAVGPTSAMIWVAESAPRPGTSASRSTASWCWRSRLAISWSSWLICCSRNCNCSSAIFSSRRYTGLRSVVRHNHCQHLLMNIDSRYPVGHSSSWRERRTCCGYLNQGRGLSPLPQGKQRRPIIRSNTHAPDQTSYRPRLIH